MGKSRNSSRGKTDNPNGGFTLIEVVISIGILVIVSLPILHYFTESIRYSSMMERRQQAAFLAQEITEGLLAESELIAPGAVSGEYTVPYLINEVEWNEAPQTTMEPGDKTPMETGDKLVITASKDGFKVEVTIDNPGDSEKVQDLLDYRIDAPANVIYIDTTENVQAVFEFMGMYKNNIPGLVKATDIEEINNADEVNEDMIRRYMSREMKIGLSQESGKYRVTMRYVYTCSAFKDMNGKSVTWTSGILMDRTVEDLQNIYLLYDWCDKGDTITLIDNGITDIAEMNLGLYVICQPRDGKELPANEINYGVIVDNSSFHGTLFGYTNLDDRWLQCKQGTLLKPSDTVFSGDMKPAVAYTIHTKVYQGNDLLADIMMTKGE